MFFFFVQVVPNLGITTPQGVQIYVMKGFPRSKDDYMDNIEAIKDPTNMY